MGFNTKAYRVMRTARLYTVLTCSFQLAQHITLRFENTTLPEKIKTDDLRAFLKRAKRFDGKELRYIVVPEYNAENDRVVAYHFITDLPKDACDNICSRWNTGNVTISTVDVRRRDALPNFMFDPACVKNGCRFYSTSRSISRELSS